MVQTHPDLGAATACKHQSDKMLGQCRCPDSDVACNQSCCRFLDADNGESDPIEVDDFDTAPIATESKKDSRSKTAAIDMLLKLRSRVN